MRFPAVELRRGVPEDADFIARLAESAFRDYGVRPGATTAAMLHTFPTWIAECESRPLGFSVVERQSATCAALQAIAVIPSFRGHGVGRRLMAGSESLARRWGCRRLELRTADSNLSALDLFLRRGFRIVGRLPGYYAHGQTACVLVKTW